MKEESFSDRNLSNNDLLKIKEKYGDNVNDIYELSAGQAWMFHAKKNHKSAFFLQMLLKVEFELEPFQFRDWVNKVCEAHQALRFAYVSEGMDRPHCVELKKRDATLKFRDLSKLSEKETALKLEALCEADRSRGFDLENDPLLRVLVYKLHKKNEYAIIISQPHINSDGTSIGFLIKDLFINYVLGIDVAVNEINSNVYKKISDYRSSIDTDKELAYWKQYLKDATEDITLPGMVKNDERFDQCVCIGSIAPEVENELKKAPAKFKVTQYNLLQTVWAITLNRLTGRSDILFGAIASGRDAGIPESMTALGGFVRAVPVRIQLDDNMYFDDVVKNVQKQFFTSMQYVHCSPDKIKQALGRKEPIFNHILNCHNFNGSQSMAGASMELPGFKILGGAAYDNLSEDLAIYFREVDGHIKPGIGYNSFVFTKEIIELYLKVFNEVLGQIFLCEKDIKIGDIKKYDRFEFESTAKAEKIKKIRKIRYLKNIPILSVISDDDLMSLASETYIKTFLEEDVVFDEDAKLDYIPILVTGLVGIGSKTRSGWAKILRICEPGDILSLAGVIGEEITDTIAVVKSEEAQVMFVPCSNIRKLKETYPEIRNELIKFIYKESKSYKKKWTSSMRQQTSQENKQKDEVLLTIITPFHNIDMELFKKAKDSVLAALKDNWEWVIVLHNTDSVSLDEMKWLFKDFQNVAVVEKRDKAFTPSSPRNKGLEIARGRYVYFLDGDDVVHQDFLNVALDKMEKRGSDVVIGKVDIDADKEEVFDVPLELDFPVVDDGYAVPSNPDSMGNLLHGAPMMLASKVIRKSLIKENNISFDENILLTEDALFSFECYLKANEILVIGNTVAYTYVQHGSSLLQSMMNKEGFDAEDYLKPVKTIVELALKNNVSPGGYIWTMLGMFGAIAGGLDIDEDKKKRVMTGIQKYLVYVKPEQMKVNKTYVTRQLELEGLFNKESVEQKILELVSEYNNSAYIKVNPKTVSVLYKDITHLGKEEQKAFAEEFWDTLKDDKHQIEVGILLTDKDGASKSALAKDKPIKDKLIKDKAVKNETGKNSAAKDESIKGKATVLLRVSLVLSKAIGIERIIDATHE